MILDEPSALTLPRWASLRFTLGPLSIIAKSPKCGVTLGVYVQYDYGKEKRQDLELWADRLDAIIKQIDFKIIPLRGVEAS